MLRSAPNKQEDSNYTEDKLKRTVIHLVRGFVEKLFVRNQGWPFLPYRFPLQLCSVVRGGACEPPCSSRAGGTVKPRRADLFPSLGRGILLLSLPGPASGPATSSSSSGLVSALCLWR